MSQTITLRLPDETADWLKDSAKRAGRSVNDVGSRLISEAQRMSEFAEIEFKTFNGVRHACVRGRLQVWQLIEVAQSYNMDPEKTADHLGMPIRQVLGGFNYYRAFPEEIDRPIAENNSMGLEKLKQLFPELSVIEVRIREPRAKR